MHRTITAVYPTELSALEVREELVRLGVSDGQITMIPESTSEAATPGLRTSAQIHERLDRLALPEDDTRTYLEAVRNGDIVLAVEVDGDESLERIKSIMRDPGQARDLDALDEEYRHAPYAPYRQEGAPTDPYGRATRQTPEAGERADLRDYNRNRDRTL